MHWSIVHKIVPMRCMSPYHAQNLLQYYEDVAVSLMCKNLLLLALIIAYSIKLILTLMNHSSM